MGLEAEILTVIGHGKSGAKSQQQFGLNFGDLSHGGKRRASLQFTGEVAKLVGGANRVNFYAPVGQVLGVSRNANLLRGVHGKITIAHALYPARNKESLSPLFSPHRRGYRFSSRSGILPEWAHGNSEWPRKSPQMNAGGYNKSVASWTIEVNEIVCSAHLKGP